jgi:hypothetical protein
LFVIAKVNILRYQGEYTKKVGDDAKRRKKNLFNPTPSPAIVHIQQRESGMRNFMV